MKSEKIGVGVLLVALAALASGCGKKDMQVSLKPAEAERNGASAALARNVEVSYRDPQGHEQVRENIPVLGLSQPMSMRQDLLKDINVEKDGRFEAKAYSGDGLLLLSGQASADPGEADGVEIELGRSSERSSDLASPLLRRVRLVASRVTGEFNRDASELRKTAGNQRCVEMPQLEMDPSGGSDPRIVFEASIKAPSFSIELGIGSGGETVKFQSGRFTTTVNASGDAEFELGRRLLDGILFKKPSHVIMRIHSDRYEGCLELRSNPKFHAAAAQTWLSGAVKSFDTPGEVSALGGLMVTNTNSMPVFVRVEGAMVSLSSGQRLSAYYHHVRGPTSRYDLQTSNTISSSKVLAPGENLDVAVYAGTGPGGFLTRQLQVSWSIQTSLAPNDPEFQTQVAESVIP